MLITKNCLICEKQFSRKKRNNKDPIYCSKKCFNSDSSRLTKKTTLCNKCNKQFKHYPSEGDRKYCSKICAGIIKNQRKYNCIVCDYEFARKSSDNNVKYCSKDCRAEGLSKHLEFWLFAPIEKKIERLRASYDKFVIKNSLGCWDWNGYKAKHGYGMVNFGGKGQTIRAHRASWLLYRGEIPENLFVCHHCDNPSCTNPDHLFLGTAADNVRDMIKKGRGKYQKIIIKRKS